MNGRSRWSDVTVGGFVLAALVLLVVGTLWIAGSGPFGARGRHYTVLLTDSAGLQPGDRVRVAGVSVGRIRTVELRPDDARPVRMRVGVRSDVAIHVDASAEIATTGMLGQPFLQIEPGSSSAALLDDGGSIEGRGGAGIGDALAEVGELSERAKALLDQASELVRTVSTEIGPVLDGLEQMLSEENVANVGALLETMNHTVDDVGPRLTTLLARLDGLAENADRGLAELPELTAELDGLVGDLRAALGPNGERLSGVLDSASRSLESADRMLSSVSGNRHEIEAMLADLRDTAANLKSFTKMLDERPYSLVRMKLPPDRTPGQGAGDAR